MADSLTGIQNAQALASKYGPGPAKGAAQVAAFTGEMRRLGLNEGQACVLGAWMGGYQPGSSFVPDWLEGETAELVCRRTVPDAPAVGEALEALMERAPVFGALVVTKAESKSIADWQNLAADAAQATKEFAKTAGKATYDGGKAALTFLKNEGVELIQGTAGFAGDVVKTVQNTAVDVATNAATKARGFLGELLPTWAWILLAVLVLAALGGWIWWQTKNAEATAKVAAGLLGG